MDLNFLYSEHQQSLMRAMCSTSRMLRTRHLASAASLARRIQAWQQSTGASAAKGWALFTDDADCADHSARRVNA